MRATIKVRLKKLCSSEHQHNQPKQIEQNTFYKLFMCFIDLLMDNTLQYQNKMNQNISVSNHDFIQQELLYLKRTLPNVRQRKYRDDSWNLTQQQIYTTFLKDNLETIRTIKQRKSFRPFSKIADLIKTRNPGQVKSHHQKLLDKFGDLDTMISKMQAYLQRLKERQRQLDERQQLWDLFEGVSFESFKPCLSFELWDNPMKLKAQQDEQLIVFEQNNKKIAYKCIYNGNR